MHFSQSLLAACGLLAVASAHYPYIIQRGYNGTYGGSLTTTTVITGTYTSVCSSATKFVVGNVTYTATASQTITITNCPCTLTTTLPTKGAPGTNIGVGGQTPTGPSTSARTTVAGNAGATMGAAGYMGAAAVGGIMALVL